MRMWHAIRTVGTLWHPSKAASSVPLLVTTILFKHHALGCVRIILLRLGPEIETLLHVDYTVFAGRFAGRLICSGSGSRFPSIAVHHMLSYDRSTA